MKKFMVALFSLLLFSFFGIEVFASFIEIPGYSVEISYALDHLNFKDVRKENANSDNSYIITDNGRFTNKYDTINLINLYDSRYDINTLILNGYKTAAFEIKMDVREENDGYQYLFVYDDSQSNTYLTGGKFEHSPGSLNTNYATYYFYFEIAIANIKENDIVLRYGASGKNEDTWDNKNLSVQIGFSKDILKTDHIWKTTGTVWTQLEMAS